MMSEMPNEKQQNLSRNEPWDECNPGEIQGMVKSLKRSRRNRELTQVASVGATFVLLFAITIWAFPRQQGANGIGDAGFMCADVINRAEDYVAGHLEAAINGRIEEHLAHCESCTQHVGHLRAQVESEIVIPPVLQSTESNQFSITSKSESKRSNWTLALASN